MKDKIYVLYGATSDYSDYREWNVAAFREKRLADQWIDGVRRIHDSFGVKMNDSLPSYEVKDKLEKAIREIAGDENVSIDKFTGVMYYVQELDLL